MTRRICLKVSFGENKQLSALAAVKRNILEARSGILNEVKPAFKDWNYQHPEIKVEERRRTHEKEKRQRTVRSVGTGFLFNGSSRRVPDM